MRIRYNRWSANFGREGQKVFKTCVSWTLTPYLTGTSHWRSVFRQNRKRRKRSIWSPNSSNVVTIPPLLCRWMASSSWRRKLRLNVYPYASRRNGSNPTHGCAASSILGWPSPWSVSPATVTRYPGCRIKRSLYSNRSGRMGPAYTSSDKGITGNKNLIEHFILCPTRRKSKKSGYQTCYFWEKMWETFHQNCDWLNYHIPDTHVRIISRTRRAHSNYPAQIC